jgi:PKD repeat protein
LVKVRGNVRFIFLAIVIVISLVAVGVFTVFPIKTAEVAVEPDRVEDVLLNETFTIDLTVADAEDIQGWDANITFDPTILEVVDAAEGGFIKSGAPGGVPFFKYTAPDGKGYIYIGASYYMVAPPGTGVNGSGILANITFQVVDIGNSPIHFKEEDMYLWYNNGTGLDKQPRILHDGFFTNLHDIAITGITVSPTQVNPGDQASINVTVVNEGNFNETFSVTIFQSLFPFPDNLTKIDHITGVTLEAGSTKTLEFTWNTTTGERSGIYNITAEVPPVAKEAEKNIADNVRVEGTVTIPGAPVAFFTYTPEKPTPLDTVWFDASKSYDPDDPVAGIVSYKWDFGDGTSEIYVKGVNLTNTATHNYTTIANYDVRITVNDNESQTDNYTRTLTIKVPEPPVASFNCTTAPSHRLINRPVAFDASESYDPDFYIVSYEWDFGDGTIEFYNAPEGVIVTHNYTDARTYTVNLTVTDNHGASDSSTLDVTVSTKRDIVVVSVTCYRPREGTQVRKPLDQAYVGETLNISVVVRNEGTQPETFNLTVYYDNTEIKTESITNLPPGDQAPDNQKIIGIFWDTTPVSAGNYTITVEAVLNEDQNQTNNKATTKIEMNVPPDMAITNVTVSPTTVLAGDLLNITVFIKNEGTYSLDCNVKISFSNDTHSQICPTGSTELTQKVLSVKPDEERALYFTNWNLTESQLHEMNLNMSPILPGTYTLSAEVLLGALERKYEFDLDDNLYIYGNVTIGTSLISIFTSKTTITVGSITTINGSITPARHGANVTIWYRLSEEETWRILETLTTDKNSTYIYDWTPEDAGTYHLKTSWPGDNMTLPDESDVLEISVQASLNIFLYVAAGAAIVAVAAVAIYFLKVRKVRKSTQ